MSNDTKPTPLAAPIHCGFGYVGVKYGLRKAASEINVAASALCRASDADDETLWKLDEAYRTIAVIINRLESDIPTQTVAERKQKHGHQG